MKSLQHTKYHTRVKSSAVLFMKFFETQVINHLEY